MTRSLKELLAPIHEICTREPERGACSARVREQAQKVAALLPWFHRTGRYNREIGKTAREMWRGILAERRLAPSAVKEHEQAAGRTWSVYLFVGACAFPKGNVVLAFRPEVATQAPAATFSPFDSGSLAGFAEPRTGSWGDDERCRFLQEHTGECQVLEEYLTAYLASHFSSPEDYVTLPQLSEPGFPTYHGLRSLTGDRRAWTVEVQAHGEEGLALVDGHPRRIFVKGKHFLEDTNADLKALVQLVDVDEEDDADEDPLSSACSRWVLATVEEAA